MTLSLRKPLVAVFAILLMVAMVGFAQPAQAACAQNNTKDTGTTSQTWDHLTGYWTSSTPTGGSPCVDINVKNVYTSTYVAGTYDSPTYGQWIDGAVGWVWDPAGTTKVVVSDITPSGINFKTGSQNSNITQNQTS